jgi:hypothetical protein
LDAGMSDAVAAVEIQEWQLVTGAGIGRPLFSEQLL